MASLKLVNQKFRMSGVIFNYICWCVCTKQSKSKSFNFFILLNLGNSLKLVSKIIQRQVSVDCRFYRQLGSVFVPLTIQVHNPSYCGCYRIATVAFLCCHNISYLLLFISYFIIFIYHACSLTNL